MQCNMSPKQRDDCYILASLHKEDILREALNVGSPSEAGEDRRQFVDQDIPKLVLASDCSDSSDERSKITLLVDEQRESAPALDKPVTIRASSSCTFVSALEDALDTFEISKGKKELHVRWGTVTQRKYPIIPGDHPDTVQGPPLTIDWVHVSESERSVDEFESRKGARRTDSEMRLGWITRRRMLRKLGISDEDMEKAQRSAEKTRKRRETTVSMLKFQRVAEIQEKVLRRVGRTFHPRAVLNTKY